MPIKRNKQVIQQQSGQATALSHKIIALHKRLIDAGINVGRLDVMALQTKGKKYLTGEYSRLLDIARRV